VLALLLQNAGGSSVELERAEAATSLRAPTQELLAVG
jgi:hypothetical protein